jgi:hypothetical protein
MSDFIQRAVDRALGTASVAARLPSRYAPLGDAVEDVVEPQAARSPSRQSTSALAILAEAPIEKPSSPVDVPASSPHERADVRATEPTVDTSAGAPPDHATQPSRIAREVDRPGERRGPESNPPPSGGATSAPSRRSRGHAETVASSSPAPSATQVEAGPEQGSGVTAQVAAPTGSPLPRQRTVGQQRLLEATASRKSPAPTRRPREWQPIPPAFSGAGDSDARTGAVPHVHITIGRVEVRAAPSPPSPSKHRKKVTPRLSIDAYVQKRGGKE